jgi:hypothetical protein
MFGGQEIMTTPEKQDREKQAARWITFCALYFAPMLFVFNVLGKWAFKPNATNSWM